MADLTPAEAADYDRSAAEAVEHVLALAARHEHLELADAVPLLAADYQAEPGVTREDLALVLACLALHVCRNVSCDPAPQGRRPTTNHLHQILTLLAGGLTDAEIGQQMHLAQGTVRSSMPRICQAYGATNRAHAVALAFRRGDLR